jgi:hypothetical protein
MNVSDETTTTQIILDLMKYLEIQFTYVVLALFDTRASIGKPTDLL